MEPRAVLVLDTNFIVQCLPLIKDLVKLANTHSYFILIPTVVLEELDTLKLPSSKYTREVSSQAREGTNYLLGELAKSNPSLRGQDLTEVVDAGLQMDSGILDCCRYFRRQKYLVVLLSNDKNLCVRALSNRIRTISFPRQIPAQVIASAVLKEVSNEGYFNETPVVNHAHIENSDVSLDVEMKTDASDEPLFPEVVNLNQLQSDSYYEFVDKVEYTLRLNLARLVEYTMHKSYSSEDLEYFGYTYNVEEPAIVRTILRFWVGTFSVILTKRIKTKLQALQDKKNPTSPLAMYIDLLGGIVLLIAGHYGQTDLYAPLIRDLKTRAEAWQAV